MKRDARIKEVEVRAIDVGHFNTKYTIGRRDSGDDSRIQTRVFTSLAPQVSKTQTIDTTGIAPTSACIVGVDGADYWVGPSAVNQARGSEPRFVNDDCCLSPKYYALMLGALNDMAQQEDAEHELVIEQLVLGLPLTTYVKHVDALQSRMTGSIGLAERVSLWHGA